MRVVTQALGEILDSLRPLTVDWEDDLARAVIQRVRSLPNKAAYTEDDVRAILDNGAFEEGILIIRLFLGLSKDSFEAALRDVLGPDGVGVKRYKADPNRFLAGLADLGILDAITAETSRQLHWSDTLVERLRSGRGSAIAGQKRGRGVEDFAEEIVRRVFDEAYECRVNFTGRDGRVAKCDFAVPSRGVPRILIEAKGYGATGSKMTDVIGDIEKIISAKRADTVFLFFTDGLTWRQRQADLKKIVSYQNKGDIARIYTHAMADQFEADLRTLKREFEL